MDSFCVPQCCTAAKGSFEPSKFQVSSALRCAKQARHLIVKIFLSRVVSISICVSEITCSVIRTKSGSGKETSKNMVCFRHEVGDGEGRERGRERGPVRKDGAGWDGPGKKGEGGRDGDAWDSF